MNKRSTECVDCPPLILSLIIIVLRLKLRLLAEQNSFNEITMEFFSMFFPFTGKVITFYTDSRQSLYTPSFRFISLSSFNI